MLTLYAFSRENWARSDDEVTGLFGLLEPAIASETDELRAQGVRVRLLGRLDELPDDDPGVDRRGARATADGTRLLLNIAFNYAGRTELVDAVRRIVASGVAPRRSTSRRSSKALYTAGLPDPDLVIRTGGEQRREQLPHLADRVRRAGVPGLLWPDFGPQTFDAALFEFARRPAASDARGPVVLRTRTLSSLVLVPPLVIALWIGVPAIAAVLVLVAALGGLEVFRLLKQAGYPSLSLFGTALAVALVLEGLRSPPVARRACS